MYNFLKILGMYAAGAIVVFVGFLIIVSILGVIIDGAAQYDEQHDRCLKHATNGYDIRECH